MTHEVFQHKGATYRVNLETFPHAVERIKSGKWKTSVSTSFVDRARKPWQRPKGKSEPYSPTGVEIGATVHFVMSHNEWMRDNYVEVWSAGHFETVIDAEYEGQVWSLGHKPHSMWVVTDDQTAYLVHMDTLQAIPSRIRGCVTV